MTATEVLERQREGEKRQVQEWADVCCNILLDTLRAKGFPVDDYNIKLHYDP